MSALLYLAAAVSLAWAVLLLGLKGQLVAASELTQLARSLANGLGIAHLALAYLFFRAAREPAANRSAIFAALLLMALRMANDVYDLLVLLSPDMAMVSLADLVLSIGLFVGILESLPRTLGAPPPR